jgi:hypothetical protein
MYYVDLTLNGITRRFLINDESRIIGMVGFPYPAEIVAQCQAAIYAIEAENEVEV